MFSAATKPSRTLLSRRTISRFCRCKSSASNASGILPQKHIPNAVPVPPPPSWSVKELRLTSTEEDKISEEELATLARRCLIDVRRLSPERRDKLRVHVGGIMRCASVLLDARNLDIDCDDDSINNQQQLTDEEIYDAPRGLGKMPVRREILEEEDDDDWSSNDSGESKAIMQSEGVKSKMVKGKDGEMFFSVVTKR